MFYRCKNIAFFSGRTKNPIEKFYEPIDKIYTSTWVAFRESISLGTAAVISPVGHLKWGDKVMEINNNKIGPVSQMLYDTMTGIQWGKIPDEFGWIVKID